MGTIKKSVEIDDEDILNLEDCLERTKDMQTPFTDLWPLTIKSIIDKWRKS